MYSNIIKVKKSLERINIDSDYEELRTRENTLMNLYIDSNDWTVFMNADLMLVQVLNTWPHLKFTYEWLIRISSWTKNKQPSNFSDWSYRIDDWAVFPDIPLALFEGNIRTYCIRFELFAKDAQSVHC